ncbi:MAG TPA: ABC transporter permease [Pseudonocardiaceae bacterium]|jgi:ABC-2 type transport system permease protein|nr:ABC transporter permease [Pseudonocardiaceae bacterium]
MTLLAVERIKLFTTRSPWWCMVLALVLTVGLSVLVTTNANENFPATVATSQAGGQLGLVVIMVMAALAVTTEYRFGTIKASFQAVPNRTALLTAKTVLVGVVAALVGEIIAFVSWAVAYLIKPGPLMALTTGQDWRNVAGTGLVYGFAAVIALAVGILVRQTAGAVAILLVYSLLVENLVALIPKIGTKIQEWMPFNMANNFLSAGAPPSAGGAGSPTTHMPLSPWGSMAYFVGIAIVLLGIALVSANRRDA